MTVFPPHPDLIIGNTSLNSCKFFKIFGVMFDIRLLLRGTVHSFCFFIGCSKDWSAKGNLLGSKSFRIFGDQNVLLRCFNSFTLPCLEYCSPVWSSAADSHDKNLRVCKFLISNFTVSLQHRHSIICVCFTRSFIIFCILSIHNFPTCSIPGESQVVL